MKLVFVALGSNRGDRESYLRQSLLRIQARGLNLAQVSSLYETRPVGDEPQPDFLNAVAAAYTALEAGQVLRVLLGVEVELGRRRYRHWGPRTVDLDLLLCGDEVHRESHLVVPHPRLEERPFVLVPLAEIAPDLVLPDGTVLQDLVSGLNREGLCRYRGSGWPGLAMLHHRL